MTEGLFDGVSLKARVAFWGMTVGAIAVPMLLMVTFVRNEPIARASVFGCYVATNSPALLVRDDAIHIIEPTQRTFSYIAEASKTSYQLNVRPALALSPQPKGRYVFVEQRGSGYFWPLLPAERKNSDRVRHPGEYAGRFEVYATDGAKIIYERTHASEACSNVH